MSDAEKSVEELMAEFEAREAAMKAELKALGMPDLDDLDPAAFDEAAAFKGYPDIVRAAYEVDKDALADQIAALLDAGADPNAKSPYGETAFEQCFRRSAFDALRLLLDRGAQIPDWGWGPDHLAIAKGDLPGAEIDPMARDGVGRTPLLLSCRVGNRAAAEALWPLTPPEGRTALPDGDGLAFYSALSGDGAMLDWAIAKGADINAVNRHGRTALLGAVENDDLALAEALLTRGADPTLGENISLAMRDRDAERTGEKSLVAKASDIMAKFAPRLDHMPDTIVTPAYAAHSPGMARLLADHGAPIAEFEAEMVPHAVGADRIAPTDVTPGMFDLQYAPRPGTSNPERVDMPFWREQIRTGRSGWSAANDILGKSRKTPPGCGGVDPVWSFQRFGRTATRLDDGRWVLIAGEHEDHYDPDFCIYADVTVIHPDGGLDHYIYPADVFPPTDFHTATRVGNTIWIIGSLSYPHLRREGVTQVLTLDLGDFSVARVDTRGDAPGWINRHQARADGNRIIVTGGTVEPGYVDNPDTFALDLGTLTWSRP